MSCDSRFREGSGPEATAGHARWKRPEGETAHRHTAGNLGPLSGVGTISPRSKRHYNSLVRIQLAPLEGRLLGSITPNEVDQLHRSIVGRSAANDAMKCLRMLFRWAAARDDDLEEIQ